VEPHPQWDLLREARGPEEFGEDPDSALAADRATVEGYEG